MSQAHYGIAWHGICDGKAGLFPNIVVWVFMSKLWYINCDICIELLCFWGGKWNMNCCDRTVKCV